MAENTLVIGIAGGSGSGKTTLMKNLVQFFGDDVTVISHDNYYKRRDDLTYEERCLINYDEPAAFDTALMVQQVDALRHGESIDCPVYDFTVHNRSGETLRIEPRPILIIEGILIFQDPALRELMDVRIFVDTDADIRICRRIRRDVRKRGRTLESVIEQYRNTVKPMHEMYVEPSKKYAHVIVPEGGKNVVALDIIIGYLRRHLAEKAAKSRKPEALILDIDGTLWDSRALVAEGYNIQLTREGLEHLHVSAQTLKSLFGKVMTDIADSIFASIPVPERYALMDRCMETENRFLEENPCDIGYPGVRETLEALKGQYRLFIVSNSQKGYPELCIEKLGLSHLIEGHLCFGDTGTSKGQTILRLMEKHGIASAVYIGDTPGDYEAAQEAGIPFVWATYGFGVPAGFAYKIDSFSELKTLSISI